MKTSWSALTVSLAGVLAAGALAAALVSLPAASASKADAPQTGKPAPAWELKDVDGKPVKSADFKGKVVILDFWATWCPPCRAEIPSFVALQKQYGQDGLQVVGVSLDEKGPAVVKPFMKKMAINYPVVMGTPAVTDAYGGIEAIPTTFVIDREGRIVSRHTGLASKATFEKEIKPLLKP